MSRKIELQEKPTAKNVTTIKLPFRVTRTHAKIGLLLVAILLISFVASLEYQQHNHQTLPTQRSALRNRQFEGGSAGLRPGGGQGGQSGRYGGMRNGLFGQVTAVSSTSITVHDVRSGTDSTLAVTNSTAVTNNGQSAAIGDVQIGNNVLVKTSSSDSKTATQIMINPQMRNRGATGGTQQSQNSMPQTPVVTN